ncbi:Hypothetical protein AA314_07660 [Archangium gephyra]|uniref:Uncharacterized protein n=1 Tax=Archangium gephyra TaxID=48 RepID=A0AAC8QEL9_9BACT|nr:Hypothetical protein AA314_07660 [Archangium gephyra]
MMLTPLVGARVSAPARHLLFDTASCGIPAARAIPGTRLIEPVQF